MLIPDVKDAKELWYGVVEGRDGVGEVCVFSVELCLEVNLSLVSTPPGRSQNLCMLGMPYDEHSSTLR